MVSEAVDNRSELELRRYCREGICACDATDTIGENDPARITSPCAHCRTPWAQAAVRAIGHPPPHRNIVLQAMLLDQAVLFNDDAQPKRVRLQSPSQRDCLI